MKRGFLVCLLVCAGLGAGCKTPKPKARPPDPPPDWTVNPKPRDSVYLYVVGSSLDHPTALDAREAAYGDALRKIRHSIAMELGGPPAVTDADIAIPVGRAEVMPGCVYTERGFRGYRGWVQVSFPVTERRKILDAWNAP